MSFHDEQIVNNFVLKVQRSPALNLHGAGNQTRSLCKVCETSDLLTDLADYQGELCFAVNAGNPKWVPVIQLASIPPELSRLGLHGTEQALLIDDPLQRRPAHSRIKAVKD